MKIEQERKVVDLMIKVYCKKKHKSKTLCPECQELQDYVHLRLSKCPFKDNKGFCQNCKIHCYSKDKQAQIKAVMRYSGPRMLLYHPIIAIKHLIETVKEKRKNDKK